MQTTTTTGYVQIMLSKDEAGQLQADVWSVEDSGERVAWSTGVADLAEAVRYGVELAGAGGMEFRPSILINYGL